MRKQGIILFVTSLVIVVLAFVFQDRLTEFRSLGLAGIFLINLVGSATLFFPAPAIASVVAGGALYSPMPVALMSALGGAMGEMVGFFLGHSGKHVLLAKIDGKYKIIHNLFTKFGGILIFTFALIPNPLFDVIGILSGVLAYSPVRFFMLLLAGRLLRNLFLAYLGSSLY